MMLFLKNKYNTKLSNLCLLRHYDSASCSVPDMERTDQATHEQDKMKQKKGT